MGNKQPVNSDPSFIREIKAAKTDEEKKGLEAKYELLSAVYSNKTDVESNLPQKYQCSVNERDEEGNFALMLALVTMRSNIFAWLLKRQSIDVNLIHPTFGTVLQVGLSGNTMSEVNWLSLISRDDVNVNIVVKGEPVWTSSFERSAKSSRFTDLIKHKSFDRKITSPIGHQRLGYLASVTTSDEDSGKGKGNKDKDRLVVVSEPLVDVTSSGGPAKGVSPKGFYMTPEKFYNVPISVYAVLRDSHRRKIFFETFPDAINDTVESEFGSIPLINVLAYNVRWNALRAACQSKELKLPTHITWCGNPVPFIHFILSSWTHSTLDLLLQSPQGPPLVDIQDDKGDTALHVAARAKRIDLVSVLCNYADHSIKNKKGEIAADYAEDPRMRALLRTGLEEHKKKEAVIVRADEVKLGPVVGSGMSAVVYKAAWQGTDVAVKVLRKSDNAKQQMEEFNHEVHISQLLGSHPRVVPFCGACKEPNNLMIVMNFMKYGSLEDYLMSPVTVMPREKLPLPIGMGIGNHLPELDCLHNLKTLAQMMVDVSAGILHMHSKNVIHCDISARNCLVDSFLRAYVCDFGMSVELSASGGGVFTHAAGKLLPLRWCAPECIMQRQNSRQSDSYMFAMFLCEIMGRQAPYQRCSYSSSDNEIISAVVNAERPLRPVIPYWCPMEIAEIIQLSWQHDPKERLSMNQINTRLGDYLDKVLRAKDLTDVYKPFQSESPSFSEAVLSLEEEMAISRAYKREAQSHYMNQYQNETAETSPSPSPSPVKPTLHVHTAACHPLSYGSDEGSSLSHEEAGSIPASLGDALDHFKEEAQAEIKQHLEHILAQSIQQLRSEYTVAVEQLRTEHSASVALIQTQHEAALKALREEQHQQIEALRAQVQALRTPNS